MCQVKYSIAFEYKYNFVVNLSICDISYVHVLQFSQNYLRFLSTHTYTYFINGCMLVVYAMNKKNNCLKLITTIKSIHLLIHIVPACDCNTFGMEEMLIN